MKAAFYSGKVCVRISKFQNMFSMQLIYHTLGQHFAMVECMANEKKTYIVGSNSNSKQKQEKKTASHMFIQQVTTGRTAPSASWQVFV